MEWTLDMAERKGVLRHGEKTYLLSPTESRIVEFLMQRLMKIVETKELIEISQITGNNQEKTLRNHIGNIKKKISDIPIRSIRDEGYMWINNN